MSTAAEREREPHKLEAERARRRLDHLEHVAFARQIGIKLDVPAQPAARTVPARAKVDRACRRCGSVTTGTVDHGLELCAWCRAGLTH